MVVSAGGNVVVGSVVKSGVDVAICAGLMDGEAN